MKSIDERESFVAHIRASDEWRRAEAWGAPRPGHPEGSVGRHVAEQVLPFIDAWFGELPEYWQLVALAYLHDIGKPVTIYKDGRLAGPSHSVLSADIAGRLGASAELIQVITLNDRAYSHWRKMQNKHGEWTSARWTDDRRAKFVAEFGAEGVNLRLLVLFHRADNGYRRSEVRTEAEDPVFWFESKLVEENLLPDLPPEGKDCRLDWAPGAENR